jgi:hypothetical protein
MLAFLEISRTYRVAERYIPSFVEYMVCDSAPQLEYAVGTVRATLGSPRAKFCPPFASAT